MLLSRLCPLILTLIRIILDYTKNVYLRFLYLFKNRIKDDLKSIRTHSLRNSSEKNIKRIVHISAVSMPLSAEMGRYRGT